MTQYIFKFYPEEMGGHTHVRVFAGTNMLGPNGKAGDLVFRNEEWEAFRQRILAFTGPGVVQICYSEGVTEGHLPKGGDNA